MIIWGTYVKRKVMQSGQFFCPQCEQHRAYDLTQPKKWGHLYWIPLIPMEEFDRYVECKSCSKTWSEKVLDVDPIRDQADRRDRISILVAQLMALVSGENGLSMPLAHLIAHATERLTGKALAPQAAFAAIAQGLGPTLILQAAEMAGRELTDRGKELMLTAVISASPTLPLKERERILVFEIGKSLGMSRAHLRGIIAELDTPDEVI